MSTADTSSSVGLDRRPQPSADGTEPKAPAVPKPARKRKLPVWVLVVACIVALGAAGGWYWWQQQLNALPPYIAAANGASKPSKPKSPPSIRAGSPSCSPKLRRSHISLDLGSCSAHAARWGWGESVDDGM